MCSQNWVKSNITIDLEPNFVLFSSFPELPMPSAINNSRRTPTKLTKALIARLVSNRGDKPEIFWDSELRGFGVLVSGQTGRKSYVVQYGRIPRRTVGPCELVPLEQARREAIELLGQLVKGVDPKRARLRIPWKPCQRHLSGPQARTGGAHNPAYLRVYRAIPCLPSAGGGHPQIYGCIEPSFSSSE